MKINQGTITELSRKFGIPKKTVRKYLRELPDTYDRNSLSQAEKASEKYKIPLNQARLVVRMGKYEKDHYERDSDTRKKGSIESASKRSHDNWTTGRLIGALSYINGLKYDGTPGRLSWNHTQYNQIRQNPGLQAAVIAILKRFIENCPQEEPLSTNILGMAFATLDPDSKATKKLLGDLENKFGAEHHTNVTQSAEYHLREFKDSQSLEEKEKKALRTKGKELAESRKEIYTDDQIADAAVNFWIKDPHSEHTSEALEQFKAALREHIITTLNSNSRVELNTDYAPQEYLRTLADKYKIDYKLFPIKSRMTIYPDKKNRLAVVVNQSNPCRAHLPLSKETFSGSLPKLYERIFGKIILW